MEVLIIDHRELSMSPSVSVNVKLLSDPTACFAELGLDRHGLLTVSVSKEYDTAGPRYRVHEPSVTEEYMKEAIQSTSSILTITVVRTAGTAALCSIQPRLKHRLYNEIQRPMPIHDRVKGAYGGSRSRLYVAGCATFSAYVRDDEIVASDTFV